MFGFNLPQPTTAYCGWRAILSRGYVDIVFNRCSARGPDAEQDAIVKWVNKSGAWKRMIKWAKDQYGDSRDVFEEQGTINGRTVVLMASPQASYGYLYIGLGLIDPNPPCPTSPTSSSVAQSAPL